MSEINWVDNPEDAASKAFVGSTCELRGRVFRDGEDGPGVYVALVRSPVGHWEQQSEHSDMASAKAAVERVLRELGYISSSTRALDVQAVERVAALERRVAALEAQVSRLFHVNHASVTPSKLVGAARGDLMPQAIPPDARSLFVHTPSPAERLHAVGALEAERIAERRRSFDSGDERIERPGL